MSSHPKVRHPADAVVRPHQEGLGAVGAWNDRALTWLATHVLASMVMFDLALILPLLTLPMSSSIKITLGVISGSWIQWWALPALQRMSIKADEDRAAKADVDHVAQTHIATVGDDTNAVAKAILEHLQGMSSPE